MWHHGDKLAQAMKLDLIAQTVTNTGRPWTKGISPGASLPTGDDFVLKRTYSDRGHHVIIAPTRHKLKSFPPEQDPPHAQWFKQQLVPSLYEAGEIRVGIVEGDTVVFRVHTMPHPRHTQETVTLLRRIMGVPYE